MSRYGRTFGNLLLPFTVKVNKTCQVGLPWLNTFGIERAHGIALLYILITQSHERMSELMHIYLACTASLSG